jgi:amidohydrolase
VASYVRPWSEVEGAVPQANLLDAARAVQSRIVADRRVIHQHPELAYQESATAAFVAARLKDLGIEVRTGVGGTGVIGLLTGARPGKTVLLRADMDALPILEVNEAPYASQNSGIMHACGHDGHTAMLLAAAGLLAERRGSIAGSVKFMFQPAEEGGFGAVRMIEDGLMDGPRVDGAFALHVDPLGYTGEVAVRAGATSAAADRFTITVRGRGGHAARPNLTVDPIVIGAQIVIALQTLVSREVAPNDPAVVTIGVFEAGTAENIIPDESRIRGTLRTYSPGLRASLERRIRELSAGVAQAMRGTAAVDWRPGYPSMVNHPEGAALVREAVGNLLGPEAALEKEPMMGAEDFSYVLEKVPGAMFFLGVRDRAWETPRPTHSSSFDLNEDALPIGAAVMAESALRFLNAS